MTIPAVPNYLVSRIHAALKESDEVDGILGSAVSPNDRSMTNEQIDALEVRQQAAWALVRSLVFEAAGSECYDPPLSVDLGDVVVIVYEHPQYFDGNPREMAAGWIASRRIARPEEREAPEDDGGGPDLELLLTPCDN